VSLAVVSRGTLPPVTDPDELVGLWDSALYGYGAMESSTLAILPDGTGWATWENAAGGSELVLVTWARNGANDFSITELQLISGVWRSGQQNKIFHTDPPSITAGVTRLRYELVQETPPLASELMSALKLDRPFMFSQAYALSRRAVTREDQPIAIEVPNHGRD
jgi:hypothetical protein